MSSDSKSKIIDRLNRTGKFANSFEPVSIDSKISQVARSIGAGLAKPNLPIIDPSRDSALSITAQVPIRVPLKILLSRAPTQFLYDVKAFIEQLLDSRPDGKR
jgi:hypothetical protein